MDEPLKAGARKPCYVCDAPGGKHCTKCKSRHYCSKACQLVDWNERGHKAQCKQLATEFQDRLLDELMPAKKAKEEPAIVADVAPADGAEAAARLPAVRTAKVGEASAVKDDVPDWRGTCAICLDLLPCDGPGQMFYSCCCKKICKVCSDKCVEYDKRCPLCREPVPSKAEFVLRLQNNADKGNAAAQVQLGDEYRDGQFLKKSMKRALQLYVLAAAQGNVQGQLRLGECNEFGSGVKINYKTAVQWYRRAAEQCYPVAQYRLGNMFYIGKGVTQSYDEALKCYRLAAAQGDAIMLFNLGTCYANGHGVPQDDDEAVRFYKRAAAEGHAEAAAAVGKIEARLACNSGRRPAQPSGALPPRTSALERPP